MRCCASWPSKARAVVVISSDLLEVLAIADRIVVMREGRVAGELSREEATEEPSFTWQRGARRHEH